MSDTFDAAWLALREPADHRSRAHALLDSLRAEAARRGWTRALDLGAGTGSNLRYLAPRLKEFDRWTLLDHDASLLARATLPATSDGIADSGSAARIRTVCGDLGREGLDLVHEADLVTASALLDLVAEPWLDALVDRCADAGVGALFALTYDGDIAWDDPDPLDDLVRDALNAHQLRDKGLGPALGPHAASRAAERFAAAGFRTTALASPWWLEGRGDAELVVALVSGWVEAATEVSPDRSAELRAWERRRLERVSTGGYRLRVGHRDLLALPASGPADR